MRGDAISSDGYVIPRNFAEFYARYPGHVAKRVRIRKYGLTPEELEDLVSEVHLQLMHVPNEANQRSRRSGDRISTFAPEKTGGATEGLFLAYVNLIIDRLLFNFWGRDKRRQVQTVAFADLVAPDVEDVEDDLGRLCPAMRVSSDQFGHVLCSQTINKAYQIDSRIGDALIALLIHPAGDNKRLHHIQKYYLRPLMYGHTPKKMHKPYRGQASSRRG